MKSWITNGVRVGIWIAGAVWLCAGVLRAQDAGEEWKAAAGPLMTRWSSEVSPDTVGGEYPRPTMVRERWESLNGVWQYGLAEKGQKLPFAADLPRRILVPFAPESALSGVMEAVPADKLMLYRRLFTVPAEWKGQRIVLHFGAVDWGAYVFVNTKRVTYHSGGYESFSVDVTDFLNADAPNELVLLVKDDTDAGYQPRGKQVSKPEGIWYTATSGIWQTVWMEPVPAARVNRLTVLAVPSASKIRVQIEGTPPASGMEVRAVLRDKEGGVVAEATGALGARGAAVILDFDLEESERHLWTPENPYLYGLGVEIGPAGGAVDAVESYAALRSVSLVRDDKGVRRIALNGEAVFLVGPLDQGFWPDGLYTAPSDEALKWDIEAMKELGFNAVRKHVKIEPERWYYWCDVMGLLVLQDMPSGDAYIGPRDADITRSEESGKNFRRELLGMINQLRNHPSVIMWVVYNEGWGQWDTAEMTELAIRTDPSRLINAASGWTDRGTGNILDIHVYPGPAAPEIDPERASLLGEFGGLGLPVKGHTWSASSWGYQGTGSTQELTDRYVELLRGAYELRDAKGLSGAIYTQLTDVETECNGLYSYDREVLKVLSGPATRANRGKFPEVRTAIATAKESVENEWRYTTAQPGEGWTAAGFDDSAWSVGKAGFGTAQTPGAIATTTWESEAIWLRRTVRVPESGLADPRLMIHHDEDAKVYFNGVLAAELSGYTTGYRLASISAEAAAELKAGASVTIAVECRQTGGGQYIDVGIAEVVGE